MPGRSRSSSIPSLEDVGVAYEAARRQPARRLVAYFVVGAFLTVFLVLGFGNGYTGSWERLELESDKMPDFSTINGDGVRTITAEELKESGHKRFIVVGDIHGMHASFEKMMNRLSYNSKHDYLMHVGDLIAKGPNPSDVLTAMAHNYNGNVTGVRGNHDQKVIEWRAWIEWVQSHKGGRAWLRDMERKLENGELSEGEMEKMKKKSGKKWKIPDGWKFGKEHYWIARNLHSDQKEYLNNLPLVLHFPSYHLFFVHAGILPLNPTIPLTSKHQPLSHVPGSLRKYYEKEKGHHGKINNNNNGHRSLDLESESDSVEMESFEDIIKKGHAKKPKNKHDLRVLQEKLVLKDIPQNTVPFNLMNIRSLKHNTPTRTKKGRPWSEIWNDVIERCKGFPDDAIDVALSDNGSPILDDEKEKDRVKPWWEALVNELGDIVDWEKEAEEESRMWSRIPKKLPCNPSTVVYGHAAGRGLDVKRWSLGLDSGCVYGRKLTALVFSENEEDLIELDSMADLNSMEMKRDDQTDEDGLEVENVTFGGVLEHGGQLHGRTVSMKCPDVGA